MSLLDAAPEELEEVKEPSLINATQEELVSFVIDKVENATDEIGTMFGYKLIADFCIHVLTQYHSEGFQRYIAEGNTDVAEAWASDKAKLEIIASTLRDIDLGSQDFQSPDNTCTCD